MKKFIAMLLALAMVLSLAACARRQTPPLRQRHRPLQKSLPRLKRTKNLLPLLSL